MRVYLPLTAFSAQCRVSLFFRVTPTPILDEHVPWHKLYISGVDPVGLVPHQILSLSATVKII